VKFSGRKRRTTLRQGAKSRPKLFMTKKPEWVQKPEVQKQERKDRGSRERRRLYERGKFETQKRKGQTNRIPV